MWLNQSHSRIGVSERRPRISIITPTLNSEKTLALTLDSVSGQRFKEIEHVIVDGGSTDKTLDLISSSSSVDAWTSEPDNGIADAFNKGLLLSSGELIGIINSDDWYESGALETVWAAYRSLSPQERNRTIFHGDLIVHDAHGRIQCRRPRFRRNGRWHWSFYFDMPVNHPTCFVPCSVYEQIGPYSVDYRVAMDFEWVLRAWRLGMHFCYIPSVVAHFSLSGLSSRNTQIAIREVYRAQRLHALPTIPVTLSYLAKSAINRCKHIV